ncbi:MAG: hypothetical protein FWF10_02200 [Clostridiales bacterium]|nr:hypothetical protein [Clostridiales bacterium]
MELTQGEMQSILARNAGKSESELMDAIVDSARDAGGPSVLESAYAQIYPHLNDAQRAKMEEVIRRMKGT